jgi:hypothetical protein
MTADPQALDREIDGLRQALTGAPPGHAGRVRLEAELGTALRRRYGLNNDPADLDAAIDHLRAAVRTARADHRYRTLLLARLGDALLTRFARSAEAADLDAATTYLREAGVPAQELGGRIRYTGARIAIVGGFVDWDAGLPSDFDDEPTLGLQPVVPPAPGDQRPPPAPGPPPAPAPAAPPPPAPAAPPPAVDSWSAPYGPPPTVTAPAPRGARPGPPRPRSRGSAAAEPTADRRLEFAAAYRRVIEQEQRYPLLFFVHRPDARDLVRDLIERRSAQLGGAPAVSRGRAARAVESGTTLSIVPNLLGATFEPDRIDVTVDDAVRELTFRMMVAADTPVGALDGYIDIFVGPLVIGQVPLTFEVQPPAPVPLPGPSDGARFLTVANASVFDKIFISYSQRDSQVVDLCVLTYEGLGVQVFVDRLDLRSGDDWRDRLESMIRDADVFQLYWSTSASASQEVSREWRLALALSKTRDRFIRPLYWETPMPSPPEALGHLHFSRLDLKLLHRAAKAYAPRTPGRLRRLIGSLRGAR